MQEISQLVGVMIVVTGVGVVMEEGNNIPISIYLYISTERNELKKFSTSQLD